MALILQLLKILVLLPLSSSILFQSKKRKKEKKKKERRMKILRSAVRGVKYMHIGTYFGNYFKSKI